MNIIYYILFLSIIFLLIIVYLIVILYIKFTYHFWSKQPVFHYYNLLYWINPSGVINEELPLVNKYCNFKNINTTTYDKLNDVDKQNIVNFLKTNYLRTNHANYLPTEKSFASYFENNSFDSYISLYNEEKFLIDYATNDTIDSTEIISVMTSRPLYVTMRKNKITIPVYYVDNLCVQQLYRNKNIAPQMIQTHEWFQRQKNKNIKVSLFKREGKLNGIVPLTVYNTHAYKKITVYRLKDPRMAVVLVTNGTIYLLMDFIKENISKFECTITPHIGNLTHLIKNKIIYVYLLKSDNNIVSCYFFKNTFSTYHKKPLIELTSSISNCPYAEMFYKGFTNAYYMICREIKTKYIIIENISHNNLIVDRIHKNQIEISPTAFFLYNYVSYSFKPEKIFCIY